MEEAMTMNYGEALFIFLAIVALWGYAGAPWLLFFLILFAGTAVNWIAGKSE